MRGKVQTRVADSTGGRGGSEKYAGNPARISRIERVGILNLSLIGSPRRKRKKEEKKEGNIPGIRYRVFVAVIRK